jgi:hypothetical protein
MDDRYMVVYGCVRVCVGLFLQWKIKEGEGN